MKNKKQIAEMALAIEQKAKQLRLEMEVHMEERREESPMDSLLVQRLRQSDYYLNLCLRSLLEPDECQLS